MKDGYFILGIFCIFLIFLVTGCDYNSKCNLENPKILNTCGYTPVTNATIVKLQNKVRVLQLEVEALKKQVKALEEEVKNVSNATQMAEKAAIKAQKAAKEAEIAAKRCEKAFETNLIK